MEVVLLAREADAEGQIKDMAFRNTLIQGPAIVGLLDETEWSFKHNHFEGATEALFLELPEGVYPVGMILLDNVSFEDCLFRAVTFAGPADVAERFRRSLRDGEETDEPEPRAPIEAPIEATETQG